MKTARDPVCGMQINIKEAENKGLFSSKNGKKYYFCSQHCKDKFNKNNAKKEKWYRSEKFGKIFPWFLAGILILGTFLSIYFDFMLLYMGIFFIVFSLFKMPDWKGFIIAYREYDLLAKALPFYSRIYPAIELILGIMYLVNYFLGNFYLTFLAWLTLVLMIVGALGVGIKLAKREKFQCACLGTWINVPLTKVTFLEDALMAFMAFMLIIS